MDKGSFTLNAFNKPFIDEFDIRLTDDRTLDVKDITESIFCWKLFLVFKDARKNGVFDAILELKVEGYIREFIDGDIVHKPPRNSLIACWCRCF